MVNKSKRKGTDWERQAVKLLNDLIKDSVFRRIPSSGAIGTIISEPILTGDITGTVEFFPKKFKGEAKTGYGGKTQLTLKKEWLDKIVLEANNNFSIPFLIGKFLGSRDGVQDFVVLDIETFATLINMYTDLQRSLEKNG